MSNEEAMKKWREITATRPAPVPPVATPTLDSLTRLRSAMTAVQTELCELGVKDRMSLTLGDVTDLLRMSGM